MNSLFVQNCASLFYCGHHCNNVFELYRLKACLSARVTRNIFEESEEQKENFMAQLNDTQKAEYKKIVDDIKAAKTLAEKAFEAVRNDCINYQKRELNTNLSFQFRKR